MKNSGIVSIKSEFVSHLGLVMMMTSQDNVKNSAKSTGTPHRMQIFSETHRVAKKFYNNIFVAFIFAITSFNILSIVYGMFTNVKRLPFDIRYSSRFTNAIDKENGNNPCTQSALFKDIHSIPTTMSVILWDCFANFGL